MGVRRKGSEESGQLSVVSGQGRKGSVVSGQGSAKKGAKVYRIRSALLTEIFTNYYLADLFLP